MNRPRIIPCLLMEQSRLVKTRQFTDARYIGDPINTAIIFNEHAAHEIILLDIGASAGAYRPDFKLLGHIAEQCMVPLAYGGGLQSMDDVLRVMQLGVEKMVMNSALSQPELIQATASTVGNQAVVVSIDARASEPGQWQAYTRGGRDKCIGNPVDIARRAEDMGAGEIMIHAIDREGTMEGYDTALIHAVAAAVSVPVIACGGAGERRHLNEAITAGASAAAAGSLFVYQNRKTRSVLVNYPTPLEMQEILA